MDLPKSDTKSFTQSEPFTGNALRTWQHEEGTYVRRWRIRTDRDLAHSDLGHGFIIRPRKDEGVLTLKTTRYHRSQEARLNNATKQSKLYATINKASTKGG